MTKNIYTASEKNQLESLLPKIGVFLISIGLNGALKPFMKKEHHKALLTVSKKLLQAMPTDKDTIFSTLGKSQDVFSTLFLAETKDPKVIFEEAIQENTAYKMSTDGIFMDYFYPVIVSASLPISTTVYARIETGSSEMQFIKQIFSDDREMIICKVITGWGDYYLSSIVANFDYKSLVGDLIRNFGSAIYVSYNQKQNKLSFNKLKHESLADGVTYNTKRLKEIADELTRYQNKNMQRSYLFVGKPGTGKSTMCYQIANAVSGSILKFDVSLLKIIGEDLVEAMIDYSNSKVVIIDDIDRMQDQQISVDKLLYCIESIKGIASKPIFLATANQLSFMPAASLRPGRFDKLIEFPLPTKDERLEFMLQAGIDQEFSERLVELTEEYSHSHMKEIAKQFTCGSTPEEIIGDIAARKRLTGESKSSVETKTPVAQAPRA